MSNLFKSKFFLGVMIAVVMLVGVAAFATTSDAASCSITTTLRVGSRGAEVKCLQSELGLTADGSFGPKTKAAVIAFQVSKGLTADGVFGAKSRAAWMGAVVTPPTNPADLCPNGMTLASNCTMPPSTTGGQTGPVTAMLATNNPAAGTLVAAQATADLAHFTFTGNGAVTGITLKRIGVSSDSTLSNVYLFDGATRLTDAASVSNNGMVTFSAPAGLFTVSGTRTISVKSDILTGTSGQTVGVMLTGFTTASGTVSVAISGNVHTIASATLAGVSAGTVTPSGATLNPGAGVTVWQSTLTVTQRDAWLKRIALRNVGSAPSSAFGAFKLYVNGIQVGTATGLDAMGYVTFDLNSAPVLLVAGSRVVRVDADIVSGASRTVQFSLRQAADVDFVDSSFGVNIAPTSTPWAPSAASTISGTSGGTLTIEKDVSSPSTNVVNAGTDVNLGTFKFTAYGEPVKIETLRATFTASDGNITELRNGRLLINGVQYGSTATLNEDSHSAPAYTSYTVNYTFVPGTPVLVELHADVFDNDGTDSISAGTDTLTAVIAPGSSNAIRQDSLGSFNAPSSAVSANALLVASTAITLTKNGTYASQTITLPATNYKVGSWNLTGSSVEDVLLTTLSFDLDEANATADFDEEDLTNMYVVVKNAAGAVVAQPSPIATLSTDGQDNNFSINYTLAKNTNATIELFANISDTSTPSAIDANDAIVTDLTVTGTSLISGSSITATSADTAGQTLTYGTAYITASVDASSADLAIVSDNQTIDSAAFKFSAVTSAFNVTDLTVALSGTNAATVVQNVMLYDGATLVASQAGAASVAFTGLNWNVPANTSKVLTVKLQLGTVGLGAGSSAADITTTLDVYTSTSVSTGTSDASAADSGQSREAAAMAGDALYVFAAIPTVSQSSVSASLTNAIENDFYKFVVTPNGGSIALRQLKFTVVITDNVGTDSTLTLGSLKLYRGNTDITSSVDIHNTAGATLESTNSLAEGTSTVIVTWASEEQISSATEFTLKGTPTGFTVGADDDAINVNLAYDSALQTSTKTYLIDLDTTGAQATLGFATTTGTASDDSTHGTDAATVTDGPNVIWSDISALPHDETVVDAGTATTSSGDWRNGYLIQTMPLSGMTKTN
jgi:peptidoglycan hydrolase-like protein with peptidoglycan-binding domain